MKECIILSGGLGTRLAHILPDIPKSLAIVHSKPFLNYLIDYLIEQKIDHFIFSIGYKSDQIINFVKSNYPNLKVSFCIENSPLGTGGAIINSMKLVRSNQFFVCNADTYYPINLEKLEKFHSSVQSDFTIGLKPMLKPYRYGTVTRSKVGKILDFVEKKDIEYGLINGGIYLINKNYLNNLNFPHSFSLEKELLEKRFSTDLIFGQIQDVFFIDIGIPDDYELAQKLFSEINNFKTKSSLILDRDGVINELRLEDYVKNWKEFKFRKDFLMNIKEASNSFDYIFVVTNQQGIGKGIMKESELIQIHELLTASLIKIGVRIEKIYYCPHLVIENCTCRKPKAGMLDQMKKEFPIINFEQSLLVGDSQSDISLAQSRHIKSVFINNAEKTNAESDYNMSSWYEFESILSSLNLDIN
ncbi:MAG: HAD-IIIA family hydrolase [Saprospiraceae bacterium]